jgi:GT2 family glycosyltransferase
VAAAPAAPTFTVVICAYTQRRWPQLTRAVGSVLAQRTAPAQVVLVIDHEPALLERAAVAFPAVTVVSNPGPRGLSGARNAGMACARAAVIAFLDDDAEAYPDWLTNLARHYRDPAVLGVGGWVEPAWDRPRPRWLPSEFDWVVGCGFTGQPRREAPVRNLIGCNMSFRRDALERAGGFDRTLGRVGEVPVGCEETELCIRLRRRTPGGVVVFDPAAAVRHRVTAERATWRYFYRRCFAEGRSKAVVARLVGAGAALSAEREYVLRTLPRGVLRELSAARAGDPAGLLRAAAIVVGLVVTTTSYLLGRARRVTDTGANRSHRRARGRPEPVLVAAVEIADGIPALPDRGRPEGGRYGAARVLVRLRGRPLGLLHVDLPPGGLTAPALAELISQRFAAEIDEPGRRDRRPVVPAPFVSVVVPTCGREVLLRRALDSLRGVEYPRFEIVVVDNRPDLPGTAALVAEWRAGRGAGQPPVRYVREPRRGVVHARNRGLVEARGEIVAFADDDVVVDRGWLRALVDDFADPRVVAVTGLVLARELETPAQLWVEQYGGFSKGFLRHRFEATGYETVELGQVRRVVAGPRTLYPYLPGTYGTGANVAFRAGVLRELGGFDPVLGADAVPSGEDIDVLIRVVLAGHVLTYQPSAIVWHAHPRELRVLRRTIYGYGVGLGAVMAKCLVMADRTGRRQLVRRLPRGIGYALRPRSAKNAGKRPGYPASLTVLEAWGVALGLAYYARAARAARRAGARS